VELVGISEKILISGTGRCGTTSISKILTEAGIRCGHESIYGVHEVRKSWGRFDADSSWMAIPHFKNFDGSSILLIREPIACISSMMSVGMFDAEKNIWIDRIRKWGYGLGVEEACRFYVEVNQLLFESCNYVLDVNHLSEAFEPRLVQRWEKCNHRPWTKVYDVGMYPIEMYKKITENRFRGDLISLLMPERT